MTECRSTQCPLWAMCDRTFDGDRCRAFAEYSRQVSWADRCVKLELQNLKLKRELERIKEGAKNGR